MEHSDKNDTVLDGAVEKDEAVNVPASQVGCEFWAWSTNQIIVGQQEQFFIEQPDDHFGVLRTALCDVILDRDVVFPTLAGYENAGHGV